MSNIVVQGVLSSNANMRGSVSGLGRAFAMVGLGLAGLVLGGFPYWAAWRVMHPVLEEAMPTAPIIPWI